MARDRPGRLFCDDFIPEADKQLSEWVLSEWVKGHSELSHDFFVPAWPFERSEGKAAGGGVVERDADAPQVHRGTVLLLVVFSQHSALVHVRVLHKRHMKRSYSAAAAPAVTSLTGMFVYAAIFYLQFLFTACVCFADQVLLSAIQRHKLLVVLQLSRRSKVGQLVDGASVLSDHPHDVSRFDVPVNDAVLSQVVHTCH